ncbi:MAG: HD domain-containing protein [bacterium]
MTERSKEIKKARELKPGEKVTSFFVVRKKELKTKADGTPYLLLGLGDDTGRITATLWDDAKSVYETIGVGDIVKVRGTVMTYRDALQLSVEKIRKSEPSDHVDAKNFIPQGEIDRDALMIRVNETIASIQSPPLKRLLQHVFVDSQWIERFNEAPGGKLWHHAYIGGLLEHTLAVVQICETMARLYPKADRDLLITGALLHDIGKIEEYRYDQGFIEYTDEGRLWGHISIGAQRIRTTIEEIEKTEDAFPQELKKQILHLILSHQGKLEHGSPVLPATLEAIILYYADEMDSKANAVQHIVERDSEPGRRWSQYINLLERFIYLKNSGCAEEENPPPFQED